MTLLSELFDNNANTTMEEEVWIDDHYEPKGIRLVMSRETFIDLCQSAEFRSALIGECEFKSEREPDGDEYYETSCGNALSMTEGNLSDNWYKHCPFCGKKIKSIQKGIV